MMLTLKYQKKLKSLLKNNCNKNNGVDKELVSKIAADIKNLKPVEPYKAKGIKEEVNLFFRKKVKEIMQK